MCGIAGFVSARAIPGAEKVLSRMTETIRHRGPDDSGVFHDSYAHLGHRRLSIIDVAGGHQPLANEDGQCLITFNGEIFNHSDLRPALEQAGHRYTTRSDTETVLHLYEEEGPRCVERFRGMFAFAIWDRHTRTLFCARDRLGIKPFYYYWDGQLFAFASEIKALLEHPGISTELEEEVLPEYLAFGYVSEERTLFRGIRKLMPGHRLTLVFKNGAPAVRIEQYWDVPAEATNGPMDDAGWIAETRRRLEETVRMRLMSDVPLGTFLSGGLDSSVIAAIIRRMSAGRVKTFAVGYAEEQFSELEYAARVARAIGTEHHEVRVGMEEFFSALPRLVWHEDEPIAWPSSVSLYFVSRLAARHVKVVLTGEGSDELFGGYQRYRWTLWNERWAQRFRWAPERLRSLVRKEMADTSLLRASLRRKLRHTFLGRENSLESLYLENFYGAFTRAEQEQMLPSAPGAAHHNFLRYWNSRQGSPMLERMLYADQKTYLVELLMKQDQMSMATSIEGRVPFLDHQFVEFAMSIPDRLKIRENQQKYVLKKAVEDLLPRDIIHRTKMGFPTPMRQWLLDGRAKPVYEALAARDGFLASYLDLNAVESLVARHRSSREDATDRIWNLINLEIWGETFFGGGRWSEGVLSREKPLQRSR